jgi:hypothetical protein
MALLVIMCRIRKFLRLLFCSIQVSKLQRIAEEPDKLYEKELGQILASIWGGQMVKCSKSQR